MEPLNVLLISYLFPPIGGVGVMRAASLARYFPERKIRLDVLTTRNPAAVGFDQELLDVLPSDVTIHRTWTPDLPFGIKKAIKRIAVSGSSNGATAGAKSPKPARKMLKTLLEYLLLPDPQVTWYPTLLASTRRLIRERNIQLVLITVPPFSNLLIIKKLRQEFPDLPIVIDFRDEWIATSFKLVSFSFSSSKKAEALAWKLETTAIENATDVVAVTDAALKAIRERHPRVPASKFHVVPNGYDATRLPCYQPPKPRSDGKVLLTHVGTVYPTTSPLPLVEAIESLPEEVRSCLKMRFIGHVEEPRFKEALLKLGDVVELKGFLPQREALAAINDTDYLLLLNHDPINVGGKFFEYIGARRPILGALHPEGETRHLLEATRAGWWASIHDAEGIRKLLTDAIVRHGSLVHDFQPDRAKIASYERRVIAHRYAELLHEIAARRTSSQVQVAKSGV